jgi:hypothetical protein
MTDRDLPAWVSTAFDAEPGRFPDLDDIARRVCEAALSLRPFFEEVEALEPTESGRRLVFLRLIEPALALSPETRRTAEEHAEARRLREQIASKAGELAAILRQAERLPPTVRLDALIVTEFMRGSRMVGYCDVLKDLAAKNRRQPRAEGSAQKKQHRSDLARFLAQLPSTPALTKRALSALCHALFPQVEEEAIGKAIARNR